MKYILIAMWLSYSGGVRWNEVAMQEFDTLKSCINAKEIVTKGHIKTSRLDKTIHAECAQK